MNVFVYVYNLKQYISINTNAANPEYCNISTPWPLEQEPGLKQGLTVLLYEFFYVC